MRTLKQLNVKGKKALLRCDFNVPLEQGRVMDGFRIERTLPTIECLLKQGARLVLLSHLGRPAGAFDARYSLAPVAERLQEMLKMPVPLVHLASQDLPNSSVVLLENLRFYPGEETNDLNFARDLARLGDIYVNDGFSVCHREHASVVALPRLLPSAAGLLLQSEVETLTRIMEKPKRPLTALLAGVKLETKLGLIKKFLNISDHLLLAGQIANALCLKPDCQDVELTNPKLHLPVDGFIAPKTLKQGSPRIGSIGSVRPEESLFDIGPETIKMFSNIIKMAKTVFWSGPLGYVEDGRFAQGSLAIAQAIIGSRAFSVVGGGDTDAFLAKNKLREKFSYVSTGGGAMLSFLAGEKLPGLEALK